MCVGGVRLGGGGAEREREKEAEGHLCNQPQPDTSAVITETLKNLHLAFKSLIREPLKRADLKAR